jgi:hypothetical protein
MISHIYKHEIMCTYKKFAVSYDLSYVQKTGNHPNVFIGSVALTTKRKTISLNDINESIKVNICSKL